MAQRNERQLARVFWLCLPGVAASPPASRLHVHHGTASTVS